jgi:hypothetical protein
MADYAGAVAAIKQRMIDNWTTTPIDFQNESPQQHVDANGSPIPWVYCEIIGNGSSLRGAGTPGDHIWIYSGLIAAHVFVPVNTGTDLAQQYAVAIGEIFRAQGFYSDDAGRIVRTWSPRTDGGGSDADDGNWFVVTCRIPFEYLHRG